MKISTRRHFSPILPPEPLSESTDQVVFQSDITTEEEENNIFECEITDSGTKEHAIVVFHHWYARNRYSAFAKFFAARYHRCRGYPSVSLQAWF